MAAGVNFTVKQDRAEEIGRALLGLQLRMGDLRPVMKDIGAALLTSTQKRFEDEQSPSGAPWRLLSAETVLNRLGGRAKAHTKAGNLRKGAAKRVGAMAILRDSGRLYQSLTFVASRSQVEIGTNTIYARIHQMGGQAGRGRKVTIPARPFLGLSEADKGEVLEIVNDFIREALP